GFAPLISTRDPALTVLRDALERGLQVEFEYLKPGEAVASRRQVSPLALVNHEGRWHLYSQEPSSAQNKTFLLRRIVSTVRILSEEAVSGAEGVAEDALADLTNLYDRQIATLAVSQDSDAWSALSQRLGTQIGEGELRVHYTDVDIFAGELSSFGDDVMVLEPVDLRDRVIAHLRKVVAHHG
ncbi:MAG: WYL domain-containing protein, partial [Pontimonas sp.]|nr:WYL domain-containing protein [Pontimonas sp.]